MGLEKGCSARDNLRTLKQKQTELRSSAENSYVYHVFQLTLLFAMESRKIYAWESSNSLHFEVDGLQWTHSPSKPGS